MREKVRSALTVPEELPSLNFVRYGPPEFRKPPGLWMCRERDEKECDKQYRTLGVKKKFTLKKAPVLINLYSDRDALRRLLLQYRNHMRLETLYESLKVKKKEFVESFDNKIFAFGDIPFRVYGMILNPNMEFGVDETDDGHTVSLLKIWVGNHFGFQQEFPSVEEAKQFISSNPLDTEAADFLRHKYILDIRPGITIDKICTNDKEIGYDAYVTIQHDQHIASRYKLTFVPWAVTELYPPMNDKGELTRTVEMWTLVDHHINDAMNFISRKSIYEGYEHNGLWNNETWLMGEVMVCGSLAEEIIKTVYDSEQTPN